MDLETLKQFEKVWWSQKTIDHHPPFFRWIEKSYQDPLSFWNVLFEYSKELMGAPTKSAPFESYNFYHDCILRHLQKEEIALKIPRVRSWTYMEIHALVNGQLPLWKEEYGLKEGNHVVLFLSPGVEWIVALMTAVRLGVALTIASPQDRFSGKAALLKKLEKLKADAIITTSQFAALLPQQRTVFSLDLSVIGDRKIPEETPFYGEGTPINGIPTHLAYLCPLRDALLFLRLRSGSTWAHPLSSMTLEEPFATFAALLSGATILHIPEEILVEEPFLLKGEPIDALAVSLPLQKLWTETGGCPEKVKFWYKNPLVSHSHDWITFSEINGLTKTPSSNLYNDPSRGGMTLISEPRPFHAPPSLLPGLGIPWHFTHLSRSGEPTTDRVGLFRVEPYTEKEETLVLSKFEKWWIISGGTVPLKEGRFYPFDAVEKWVSSLEFVNQAVALSQNAFILLVFISPTLKDPPSEWISEIEEGIENEVGVAFVPDHTIFLPLYPYLKNGAVDRNWAFAQYQKDLFRKKLRHPLYQKLNQFRDSLYPH